MCIYKCDDAIILSLYYDDKIQSSEYDKMEPTVDEYQDAREQLMAGRMTRSMLTTTVNTQQVMDTLAHLTNSSCMSTCCTTWKGTWNKRERQFLYQRCHSIVDARHSAAFVRL